MRYLHLKIFLPFSFGQKTLAKKVSDVFSAHVKYDNCHYLQCKGEQLPLLTLANQQSIATRSLCRAILHTLQ